MRRFLFVSLIGLLGAGPAEARMSLGVFGSWGVFRDDRPARCYAISEPDVRHDVRPHAPYVTLALFSGGGGASGVRFHVRLRKDRAPATPVTLRIGGRQFALVAGRADAWAADDRMDAAIVRALRSGEAMFVTARDGEGRRFSDSYRLRGVATAIDAAQIGCARQR